MTFYEAALEVLRKSGRALHYKKITEVAIRDDLLAHVGRTPLEMMEQRLEFEAKKGDAAWIFQTRPGVYTLKESVVEELNEKADERAKKEEKRPKEKRRKRRTIEADMDRAPKKDKAAMEIKGTFPSVADAAFAVLEKLGGGNPLPIDEIATVIFNRKLVSFHTHEPELTTESALILDNAANKKVSKAERFVKVNSDEWALSSWAMSKKGRDCDSKICVAISEIHEQTLLDLNQALKGFSKEVFEMIVAQLMAEMGFTNIKIAKRTNEGDVILSANRQDFSSSRICIFLPNTDNSLQNKHLKNFKKSLGHYSASEGIVIYFGKDGSGLVKTAKQLKLEFIDQKKMAQLLFDFSICVKTQNYQTKTLDNDLIKALS